MNDDRRSRLLGIKLRALIAEHRGVPTDELDVEPGAFPSGATLLLGDAAWVLVEGPADRSLGAAIAWALRQGATSLDLVAERDTGLLARRAAAFTLPIRVWFAEERTLLAAVPEPLASPPIAAEHHVALSSLIESGGATPNVEHGVVTGEVRGLEVCRVVDEPTLGRLTDEHGVPLATGAEAVQADGEGGVILEVGVGANDREAFQLLHGHLPKSDALADVVDSVRAHRRPGAAPHPLNRMAPERALRSAAIDEPATIGLASVEPAPPPVPRPSMKDTAPCVARGRTADGAERMVVFSSGVDVELAPYLADVNAMVAATGATPPPLVVVLAPRDLLPITERMIGLLDHPVSIVHPGSSE